MVHSVDLGPSHETLYVGQIQEMKYKLQAMGWGNGIVGSLLLGSFLNTMGIKCNRYNESNIR